MRYCFPDYVCRHLVASAGNLTSHLIEKLATADSKWWLLSAITAQWSNERGFHVRKLIRWLLLETQIKVILTRWSHA